MYAGAIAVQSNCFNSNNRVVNLYQKQDQAGRLRRWAKKVRERERKKERRIKSRDGKINPFVQRHKNGACAIAQDLLKFAESEQGIGSELDRPLPERTRSG